MAILNRFRFLSPALAVSLGVSLLAPFALGADTLVILSPHRKTLQDEFVPRFKEFYKRSYGTEVQVEWLDQGGTSNDVRFLKSKLSGNARTAGIDIFWGGPSLHFIEMKRDGLLQPYPLPRELAAQVPPKVGHVMLRDQDNYWHASAISSFGVLYNRPVMTAMGLREPTLWDSLADPSWLDQVALADPRNSGTNATINTIIMQSLGWTKGWETITAVAANARKFYPSSSDPLKAVEMGEATGSFVIDFYGMAKVAEHGKEKINFILPKDQTIMDSDPVAVVKGAPHLQVAQRFINFILSPDAQVVLMLPKGSPQGPTVATHARMAMNPLAYNLAAGKQVVPLNPFEGSSLLKYDAQKAADTSRVLNDYIGTTMVDMHSDLKRAWTTLIKSKATAEQRLRFLAPLITPAEFEEAIKVWSDDLARNKTLNAWVERAKTRYNKAASAH